jgi:hypothetical protein
MDHTTLVNEIRYAERLCQRTARLYRRAACVFLVLSLLGGSAILVNLQAKFPDWVTVVAGAVMALFTALNVAVRPAEKAASNELDAKRYAKLRSEARNMNTEQLQQALDKARETDAPEVEPLRDVAFNDVVTEYGRPDAVVPLQLNQKILRALA